MSERSKHSDEIGNKIDGEDTQTTLPFLQFLVSMGVNELQLVLLLLLQQQPPPPPPPIPPGIIVTT